MSWKTIKIDAADRAFSEYVRRRDKICQRCFRAGDGPKGITGLQASHYWSRRHENTRFDIQNVISLCAMCHFIWGGDGRADYTTHMKSKLGEQGYKALMVRCNTHCRKDRKLALMQAKLLLKTLD